MIFLYFILERLGTPCFIGERSLHAQMSFPRLNFRFTDQLSQWKNQSFPLFVYLADIL